MKVTLKDFKNNPFGKGVTAFNNSSVKESLENRYNSLIKNGKKVEVAGVYLHKGDYYIHLFIPSESERPNNYDVVVSVKWPYGAAWHFFRAIKYLVCYN